MPVVLTPNFTVGKAVAITVGGSLAYAKGGKIARSAAAIKVTNARSGGFDQHRAGTKSATLSLDAVYNGDDPPVGMVEGAEVTVIFDSVGYDVTEGIANTTSTPTGRLITGQFLITSITDSWQAGADFGWSLEAVSTGPYTVVDTATGVTPIT